MNSLNKIISLLNKERGFDFSGYRTTMIKRRIEKRILDTKCKNIDSYLEYLNFNSDEFDNLVDVFTINVSRFFRNTLDFEYINKIIIPELFSAKNKAKDNSIRIWSAGCSFGEEPYSMAILINEYLRKEGVSINLNIIASDIDKKALIAGNDGIYGFKSIKNVKYGILDRYFQVEDSLYKIHSDIKDKVQFSLYDLLDKKRLLHLSNS